MKIELTFRDDDARVVAHFLRQRYKSKAALKRLAMIAVRREVAAQAKIELEAKEVEGRGGMMEG